MLYQGSQLIAHLVRPRPGERLLDACAGRGGKTLHLAALAGEEATLVAADLHGAKLEALAGFCQQGLGFFPLGVARTIDDLVILSSPAKAKSAADAAGAELPPRTI